MPRMTADTQPMSEVEGSSPPEIRSAPSAPGDVLTEFSNWLRFVVSEGGSDLHVKVGSPPMIRYDGRLKRLDREALSGAETAAISDAILPPDRKQSFLDRGSADFAHSLSGVGRFRVNVFHQRGSVSMVLRKVRVGGPTFEELEVPDVVRKLADEQRRPGLATGPTGSGKTT